MRGEVARAWTPNVLPAAALAATAAALLPLAATVATPRLLDLAPVGIAPVELEALAPTELAAEGLSVALVLRATLDAPLRELDRTRVRHGRQDRSVALVILEDLAALSDVAGTERVRLALAVLVDHDGLAGDDQAVVVPHLEETGPKVHEGTDQLVLDAPVAHLAGAVRGEGDELHEPLDLVGREQVTELGAQVAERVDREVRAVKPSILADHEARSVLAEAQLLRELGDGQGRTLLLRRRDDVLLPTEDVALSDVQPDVELHGLLVERHDLYLLARLLLGGGQVGGIVVLHGRHLKCPPFLHHSPSHSAQSLLAERAGSDADSCRLYAD